jgi:hypothetical protein
MHHKSDIYVSGTSSRSCIEIYVISFITYVGHSLACLLIWWVLYYSELLVHNINGNVSQNILISVLHLDLIVIRIMGLFHFLVYIFALGSVYFSRILISFMTTIDTICSNNFFQILLQRPNQGG